VTKRQTQKSGQLSDDLAGGFYTVAEAARLLGLESTRRVTRWLSGPEPVILRQYQKTGTLHEVGFLDLLEIRFIEHFRRCGISLQTLRRCAQNARSALGMDHPFATSNVKFQTDRRRVFMETAQQTGDPKLLDLVRNQFAIYSVIESVLARDLTFDASGLASEWRPDTTNYPSVMINPRHAFGRPTVAESRVATAAIFNLFKAEQGDTATVTAAVARWFKITEDETTQAVAFESELAA
jgi:uncharacterized protein (DUF433 family)